MIRYVDWSFPPMISRSKDQRWRICGWLRSDLDHLTAMLGGLVVLLVLLAAAPSHADGYTFDTGDVIRVSVFNEPSYPLEVVVDDQGSISLPLLGDVMVRGLTAVALSEAIQRAFRQRELILEPMVKVEIGRYRPFFISGAVAQPGSYPFQPGITVRHALAIAGGFKPTAAGTTVPALQIADLRSERANLTIEEYRLKVRLARLHAESRLEKSFAAPPDPPVELGAPLIQDIMATEQAQLEVRLAAFQDEVSYLEESLARTKKEAQAIAATREERENAASLQLQEVENARSLRDRGLITNSNVMGAERALNTYRADIAQVELQATKAQQDMLNLENELRRKRQSHETELIANIQDTQVALAKLQSNLRYITDKLLFVFEYGEHRTFDDLQGFIKISIFRRDQKTAEHLTADESTEIRAGDVIEVAVVASKGFYAPATSKSQTSSAVKRTAQDVISGQQ